ncbi:type III secretion protein [Pseudomonas paralactis]|uniref:Type III secretion protein n=1 Tax=Pseudomonas paralactis TaxID=1615673 RepID=A0ABS0V6N9_9PSED|nr:type III secretion protein [Pseudomonas paralactis]MBI6634634.1 type III secretion protein [Pseudomonas paralactis]
MTSTSFNSSQPCRLELVQNPQQANPAISEKGGVSEGIPTAAQEYVAQARRMKAFASERKFQAPVADDFSRGMLADRQVPVAHADSLKRTGLINSLATWWRSRKSG